jgi:phenylacetate-CoA ligase
MAVIPQGEYFDKLETMSSDERRQYLDHKLSAAVSRAYRHAPAIRKIMDASGIRPSAVRSVEDLEKIPITRKTDLIEMQKASPPFGGILAIPAEDVERIFISPGPIYECQPASIKWFARSFWAAGFRKGDIAVNTFTYHMSPAGVLFHEGLRHCGTTVVVMGTGNTDTLIKTMLDVKVTGFVGTPTFLATVLKRAEEMGCKITRDFSLKLAWFTGEMVPSSLRKTFEEDYRIATSQAYAVTEPGGAIAYECREKTGMHLMDDYVVEIVDPQTGKQLGAGEIGEIVVTPVHNKAWGLIRFGTGDMASILDTSCPCGRTSARISGIMGRTGDAVKVRGMFIVARQAEQVIAGFEPVARFQIIVGRRENRDEMTLKAEVKSESIDKKKLSEELNQKFQDVCRCKLDSIQFIAPGTLPEKYQKITDERKWD